MKKLYCNFFVVTTENLKNIKYHASQKKSLVFSFIYSKCKNEDEKLFKKNNQLRY